MVYTEGFLKAADKATDRKLARRSMATEEKWLTETQNHKHTIQHLDFDQWDYVATQRQTSRTRTVLE